MFSPAHSLVRFCNFVTASPTPFHAVSNLSSRLVSSGFTRVSERQPSTLVPGGSYFYTRNQSSLVAFTLPPKPAPHSAISFAVGHLDSCCLKLRPVSKKTKSGYLQVGVELYGGGIWASWFDRDLSIAGRVIVSTPNAEAGFTSKLVKIDRPLLRIPTLAIHLDRTINEAFKFNKETEFAPILGLVADALNEAGGSNKAKGTGTGTGTGTPAAPSRSSTPGRMEVDGQDDAAGMGERHHPLLLAVLADELGCTVADIQDFEL